MGTLEERIPSAKIFELMGCLGETVKTHDEIRPALGGAFNSGKRAAINVGANPDACHTL